MFNETAVAYFAILFAAFMAVAVIYLVMTDER